MFGRTGMVRVVSSVEEAAECLLSDKWPKKGAAHRAAREALLKVMSGSEPASFGREAFRAAAVEAGIYLEAC
jgi:hypothetical protein